MSEVSVSFCAISLLAVFLANAFFRKWVIALMIGEAFDALRAPFGADLVARHAPDFLGVGFEKRQIEFFAEPVDQKLLRASFPASSDWRALAA